MLTRYLCICFVLNAVLYVYISVCIRFCDLCLQVWSGPISSPFQREDALWKAPGSRARMLSFPPLTEHVQRRLHLWPVCCASGRTSRTAEPAGQLRQCLCAVCHLSVCSCITSLLTCPSRSVRTIGTSVIRSTWAPWHPSEIQMHPLFSHWQAYEHKATAKHPSVCYFEVKCWTQF